MEKIIQEVITAVGGINNITECTNCMTRLRLTLKNETNADRQKVKNISGVFGIIENDQQFQIILGPGKAQKTADMMNSMFNF
ncbi:PTS transporter subunit EIIB [Psychromonas ossibalaenae]|uniref:PTS transporter subunit EIIB n=1 Tax=Psychromonas ossibalaenae TaxID=444922 RepID=UPI000371E0A2|nr:PTS transporter subunit EIIB [Psychromonas ossibalaenae]